MINLKSHREDIIESEVFRLQVKCEGRIIKYQLSSIDYKLLKTFLSKWKIDYIERVYIMYASNKLTITCSDIEIESSNIFLQMISDGLLGI